MAQKTYEVERVEFMFWPVVAGKRDEMFTIGETELRWSRACASEDDFIQRFMEANFGAVLETFVTTWLRAALLRAGAEKFVPMGNRSNPSIDYRPADKVFEVCAYHDTKVHDHIYKSSGIKDIIMAPTGNLEIQLEERYGRYGVSSFDWRLYAEGGGFEK
jgi:hypothetical protein